MIHIESCGIDTCGDGLPCDCHCHEDDRMLELHDSQLEQLRRTRIALAGLLKLVEVGVLVRNTKDDGDFVKYMRQSTELVLSLKQAQEVLE